MMKKEIIAEDYPSEFDFEYLQSLKSLKDIVKYATSKLGAPKKGSSRLTYLVDEKIVLKIAYNPVGIVQNTLEMEPYLQDNYENIVAKVLEADYDKNIWLEMERIRPIKQGSQLKKFLDGYDIDDLKNYLENQHNRFKRSEDFKIMCNKLDGNEFVNEIQDFIGSYDLLLGDVCRIGSWGLVVRDGVERPVLFDYGLTSRSHSTYYQHGKIKKEYR
jgi:hypothetical protein